MQSLRNYDASLYPLALVPNRLSMIAGWFSDEALFGSLQKVGWIDVMSSRGSYSMQICIGSKSSGLDKTNWHSIIFQMERQLNLNLPEVQNAIENNLNSEKSWSQKYHYIS